MKVTLDTLYPRLGNAMFQIAAASSYAKKTGAEFMLKNTWKYQKYFKNKLPVITNIEMPWFYFGEPGFHYVPISHIGTPQTIILDGYFQSDKYFLSKEYIKQLFEFTDEVLEEAEETMQEVKFNTGYKHIAGLHMRMGDYLGLKNVHNCLGDTQYYVNCINYFLNKNPHTGFLVFSDDIPLAKQYFLARPELKKMFEENKIYFMHHEDPEEYAVEDLALGTLCNAGIGIANSTYSWWMAELNKNQNIDILAPDTWFGPERDWKTDDVYTKEMVKMSLK